MPLTIELLRKVIENLPNYPEETYWTIEGKIYTSIELEQELKKRCHG